MSTIEKIANDQSLNDLFADYITCTLYLQQAKAGTAKISTGIASSLAKRLDQVCGAMLTAVRRQHYMANPTPDAVHRAALHILEQHPSGRAYFLGRLAVR